MSDHFHIEPLDPVKWFGLALFIVELWQNETERFDPYKPDEIEDIMKPRMEGEKNHGNENQV